MTRMPVAAALAAIPAGLAGALAAVAGAPGPAQAQQLPCLTASSNERGWVTLTAAGEDRATVELTEHVGERQRPIAGLSLRRGGAELRRAARWSCERRTRRFVATAARPDGGTDTATAFDHDAGVHLAAPGIRIAADILTGMLRRDGLLP